MRFVCGGYIFCTAIYVVLPELKNVVNKIFKLSVHCQMNGHVDFTNVLNLRSLEKIVINCLNSLGHIVGYSGISLLHYCKFCLIMVVMVLCTM